ncbi:MAG: hypothetical protein KDE34_15815 [Anaerolineales bacterium]|nr:hypothetical protein [Anaerolineales bacterium]
MNLYRPRIVVAAAALLFFLYCSVYLWFYVPYEDFAMVWQPDSQLHVTNVPEDSLAHGRLRPGDQILAIGNQSIQRTQPIYPLPLQSSYPYQLLRDGKIVETTVSYAAQPTGLAVSLRLPAMFLSFSGWLVGTLMLLWARREHVAALRAGYIFLLGQP